MELTPGQFFTKVEAYEATRERELEVVAWQTAYILNCWTGKGQTITPDQLLGREQKAMSKESVKKARRDLRRAFKLED